MSRIRVVLQSRTLSERLPAKVLLPLAGHPLAVLCAKRLANTGLDVVLATSDAHSDDLLAAVASASGVRVFRGSHDDVLGRFASCTEDLLDTDVIVRATGDNPFPDGDFVAELVRRMQAGGHRYLGTSSPVDGLPYGLSAECFTAGALRLEERSAPDRHAREHVTVGLRAAPGAGRIAPRTLLEEARPDLRCTVDTIDDYLRVARVFARACDPVHAGWRDLVRLLAIDASGRPRTRLTLGTVQVGMRYGIANRTSGYDEADARALIARAVELGIDAFDTARAYGEAERRLGDALSACGATGARVVTKVRPLGADADGAPASVVAALVDSSVLRSCSALRRRSVDALLLHDAADAKRAGGAALDRAIELRGAGITQEVGASVYDPDAAIQCLADPRITRLQLPFNALDSRWLEPAFSDAVRARPDVRIDVRSVFLQGLLLAPSAWPSWAECADRVNEGLDRAVRELGRSSRADLCLAYVQGIPWVSSAVVGVDGIAQLEELAEAAGRPALTAEEADAVRAAVGEVPERVIDPRRWT